MCSRCPLCQGTPRCLRWMVSLTHSEPLSPTINRCNCTVWQRPGYLIQTGAEYECYLGIKDQCVWLHIPQLLFHLAGHWWASQVAWVCSSNEWRTQPCHWCQLLWSWIPVLGISSPGPWATCQSPAAAFCLHLSQTGILCCFFFINIQSMCSIQNEVCHKLLNPPTHISSCQCIMRKRPDDIF